MQRPRVHGLTLIRSLVCRSFLQGGLTAEQTEAVAAVWKKEQKKVRAHTAAMVCVDRVNIIVLMSLDRLSVCLWFASQLHDQLVLSSGFSTPHFTSLNWRLDVQSHSRYVNEMNVPTAIVQINTKVGKALAGSERVRRNRPVSHGLLNGMHCTR
jgi:hypothetical protein